MSKEQIDNIMSKWISRKLLVWIMATIFVSIKIITSTDWLVITSIYLGTETALTAIEKYTNK